MILWIFNQTYFIFINFYILWFEFIFVLRKINSNKKKLKPKSFGFLKYKIEESNLQIQNWFFFKINFKSKIPSIHTMVGLDLCLLPLIMNNDYIPITLWVRDLSSSIEASKHLEEKATLLHFSSTYICLIWLLKGKEKKILTWDENKVFFF